MAYGQRTVHEPQIALAALVVALETAVGPLQGSYAPKHCRPVDAAQIVAQRDEDAQRHVRHGHVTLAVPLGARVIFQMDHRRGAHEAALVRGTVVGGHQLQPVHPLDHVGLALVAQRVQPVQYVQADQREVQYGQPRIVVDGRIAGQQVQRPAEVLFVFVRLQLRRARRIRHCRSNPARGPLHRCGAVVYQLTGTGPEQRPDVMITRPAIPVGPRGRKTK